MDLFDEALLRDPASGFSALRERAAVVRVAVPPAWLVTRYSDVKLVLGDRRFVNDVANVPGGDAPDLGAQALAARGIPPELVTYLATGMLELDGTDHLRLRKLVSRAFTARRVAELRPRVEEIAERLLDRLPSAAEHGVVDLLEHFAAPLPIIVICELVGVPEQDRHLWRAWSGALTGAGDLGDTLREMVAYVQELISARREKPEDDLVSALVRAQEEDGDRLSDVEMTTLIVTIVVAGHETTSNLIGNGTAALLSHPDQLAALHADPGLLPRAVDELLRWCGPAKMTRMRYATEDVEISGTLVRKGEAVIAVLFGANFDPRAFADPERLDITRDRAPHVAFSHGMHFCLGAALARQEGEVAFDALFRRFPGMKLAVAPEDLQRPLDPGSWRLGTLPVTL
ncbi:cytochrome P450 family protein [Allokutzneria oryzae]|uniref:Cytochrome P450 n=1 Tax=Allokutzneria oryzae TaxID=1378989 RepID=A0ABV6A4H6_9PSEU